MKRTQWLSLMALVALTVSCQSGNFFKREVHRLKGMSETRLEMQLGPPERVTTNTVGSLVRSPEPWRAPIPQVLGMFPTNTSEHLHVQIKSLSWLQGRILLTVWLRREADQWVSFYAEEWNMDVVE